MTLQVSFLAIDNHSFLSNAYGYLLRNADSDTVNKFKMLQKSAKTKCLTKLNLLLECQYTNGI